MGVGGEGGEENGELGQLGTDTSIGAFSTANGVQLLDMYVPFVGRSAAYGTSGNYGNDGKPGGIGAGRGHSQIEPVQEDQLGLSTDGGSFTHTVRRAIRDSRGRVIGWIQEEVVEYAGGSYADPITSWSGRNTYVNGGAGGGGAAYGGDGGDASVGNQTAGNQGGNGGDAMAPPDASPSDAGWGGHGGGGGGGAQVCGHYWNNMHSYNDAKGGKGGKGSKGGKGGKGLILAYYNPQS